MTPPTKLRVHFVTEDDPLYVIRFFEVFFAEYPREYLDIVGMTVQAPFNESALLTARRVLTLYGPLGFARLASRVTIGKLQRRSIESLARQKGIPLVETASVNDPTFVERVRRLQTDVIVSVAAPEIFGPELLETPRLGCINLHSGRLPAYRGMLPSFWQMRFGEPYATVTVHEMAPTLDAGAVLGTIELPISDRDSLDRVMSGAKREGAHLVIRVLLELAEGRATPRPSDMAEASYYSFPKREDVRAFHERGHRTL